MGRSPRVSRQQAVHRWPEHELSGWPELPIEEVYRFVHQDAQPAEALVRLMRRPLRRSEPLPTAVGQANVKLKARLFKAEIKVRLSWLSRSNAKDSSS
jgi:hypothetical protein